MRSVLVIPDLPVFTGAQCCPFDKVVLPSVSHAFPKEPAYTVVQSRVSPLVESVKTHSTRGEIREA
jgi:peptidase E